MTWEPTQDDVVAYRDAAVSAGAAFGDWHTVCRAGLEAAYAALEKRVNAGEVLGQPTPLPVPQEWTELVHSPDAWEYAQAATIDEVTALGVKGWRVEHVVMWPVDIGGGGPLFILERPLSDPLSDTPPTE